MHTLLGVRTDFSVGESLITVDSLPSIAEAVDQKLVAVADTMNISGLIQASKAAKKAGIKLVYGVRVRVMEEAVRDKTIPLTHIKLYPTNDRGMRCLFKLLSRGFDDDRMYFVPRVTWADLHELLDDDCLIYTTGATESAVQLDSHRAALADLARAKSFVASFYELVPCNTPYFSRHNHLAHEFGEANGFEPLVVMPTLWAEGHRVAFSSNAAIATNRPYSDLLDPKSSYSPHTLKQMASALTLANEAIELRYGAGIGNAFRRGLKNTSQFDDIKYEWRELEPCLPVISDKPDEMLKQMCKDGWSKRFSAPFLGHKPTREELTEQYMPRLKMELDTLKQLGFAQYFLLVADVVTWAKSVGIYVGPGRGSAGGSMVSYLLGITDVDPIRFKLLFERFINPDRLDLPDVDIDFMSSRREEVIDYLTDKYGADNVAGIVNYSTMGSRAALSDLGRIMKLPDSARAITKFIGDVHGVTWTLTTAEEEVPEVADFARSYPGAWKQAKILEGKMRNFSKHAAGVVVSSEPIVNRAVIEKRSGSRVINWDKRTSELMGLIKLDVLGLSNLDVFDAAVKMILKRHGKKLNINNLPLDDAEALKIFDEARTAGIFQFDGGSVRRLLKEMAETAPLTFEDLVALNALNRPGPLDAGLTQSYIKRRAGTENVSYPHPVTEPILEPTYGVICYQEQVMQVAVALCGFKGGEADTLRKAMGKKDPVMMAEQREKFVDGAVNTSNMPEVDAGALFDQIQLFAGYAFNRSHAVEYTLISYQAAYIKARYQVEFYASSMNIANSKKLGQIVREAKKDGIRIIPPDINVSTDQFEPLNDVIIAAPLSAVKNVSTKGANAIMRARKEEKLLEFKEGRGKNKREWSETRGPGPFKSIQDFTDRVSGRAVNSRGTDNLDRVGAFARVEPDQMPSTHQSRQKDQIELMPDISNQAVEAQREISTTEVDLEQLLLLMEKMDHALDIQAVPPSYGEDPKMMVVMDQPFSDTDDARTAYFFTEFIQPALNDAGLQYDHAVWAWVAKRPKAKGEREIPADEMNTYVPWFKRELDFIKPPIIITLGNAANRIFFPSEKKMSEQIGAVRYSAELDASIIIGFNPGQLYFSPEKQDVLADLFLKAKKLVF